MIKKKHALILGGSSDIAVEVIKELLTLKWQITAHYSKHDKNLKQFKNKIDLLRFDFSNIKNLNIDKKIKNEFKDKYDVIINLVGYIDNKSFSNTDLKSITKSFVANTAIPMIIEKNNIKNMLNKKWGRILNCSSIGIKFGGGKNSYNYSLSKHALEFIPRNYKFWAEKNVLINNLRIGMTNTKIHKRLKRNKSFLKKRIKLIPMKRMAEPKEISKHIINLITDHNSFITGETITIAGGE